MTGDLLSSLSPDMKEAPVRALPSLVIDADQSLDEEHFDWTKEDCIVVQEQRAVAVYRNRADGIVIRQEDPDGIDRDAFVVLRDPEAVRTLVAALQREIGDRRR